MTQMIKFMAMDLQCMECDKYMGTLNIECDTYEDMIKKGHELTQQLIKMNVITLCDICNASKSQRLGGYIRE